jgi:hypothetical protein
MSELALQQPAEPSLLTIISTISQSPMTAEGVGVIERLCALQERQQAKSAEQEFNRAFTALQAETTGIQATKAVPDKQGNIKWHYAPYEEVMATVRPLLQKNGFSVSFDMNYADGRVKAICKLMHVGGHSQTTEFAARIGGGPPGANETQADGAAMTYAKRFALCNALNITVEHDTDGADARGLGVTISGDQAAELRRRVKGCKADEAKFLALADAKTFEEITEGKFAMLDRALRSKEAKAKAPDIATGKEPDAAWPE